MLHAMTSATAARDHSHRGAGARRRARALGGARLQPSSGDAVPARRRAPATGRRERRARHRRLVVARARLDRARRPADDARRGSESAGASRRAPQRGRRDRPRRGDDARARPQRAGAAGCRARSAPDPRAADARGAPRQAFFRLGAEILEVVQEPAQDRRASDGGAERSGAIVGACIRRPRSRSHRRRARRARRRGARGRAAGAADRHGQALGRARRAGRVDEPRRASRAPAVGAGRRDARACVPLRCAPPPRRRGTARARCMSPTATSSGSSRILPASA